MTWGGPSLPSGLDQFTAKQEPKVEPIDDLSRFVMDRVREQETEPRVDNVVGLYNQPAGPMAHRYAGNLRADMVAFRRVVRQYVEYAESSWPQERALFDGFRPAVQACAMRWEKHPDFQEEWRL